MKKLISFLICLSLLCSFFVSYYTYTNSKSYTIDDNGLSKIR